MLHLPLRPRPTSLPMYYAYYFYYKPTHKQSLCRGNRIFVHNFALKAHFIGGPSIRTASCPFTWSTAAALIICGGSLSLVAILHELITRHRVRRFKCFYLYFRPWQKVHVEYPNAQPEEKQGSHYSTIAKTLAPLYSPRSRMRRFRSGWSTRHPRKSPSIPKLKT